MLKGFISVPAMLMDTKTISIAGTLIEDFDDGDNEGWESSPQNKDSKAFWGVDKKEKVMKFGPKGVGWKEAISQMNFVGTDTR